MLLSEFGSQSSATSYSLASSPVSPSGNSMDGPRSMATVLGAWSSQLRKRKKKKKYRRIADKYDVHHYPTRKETNISYNGKKKQDGNIEWRRRYERFGLSRATSDNRERSELPEYIGNYTINR